MASRFLEIFKIAPKEQNIIATGFNPLHQEYEILGTPKGFNVGE